MHEQVRGFTEETDKSYLDMRQKKLENIIFCFDLQRESEAISMECFRNGPRAYEILILP